MLHGYIVTTGQLTTKATWNEIKLSQQHWAKKWATQEIFLVSKYGNMAISWYGRRLCKSTVEQNWQLQQKI